VKVFGIGLNKTGTTTLGVCLQQLGFRHTACNRELTRCVSRGDLDPVFAFADKYDAFEDWPWPLIFRELDDRYPGSKFILTTRKDPETWLHSLKKHALLTGPTEYREIAYGYGSPEGHEAEHLLRYEQHCASVRAHFQNRPRDFIEVCWERGDGWEQLCAFLGKPIPNAPFPHTNRSKDRRTRLAIKATSRFLHRIRGTSTSMPDSSNLR
jgi:hypothetical protein